MSVDGSGRYENAVPAILIAAIAIFGCAAGEKPGDRDSASPPVAEAPEAAASMEIAQVEAASAEPAAARADDLVGAWLLEDLSGRGVVDMVQTTIVFDGEGRVSGGAGCNRYTGSYSLEDGRLVFGPLAATKMMCPEAVMAQEDGFMQALGAAEQVTIDGPFLLISVAGSEQPLKFTRTDADAEP